MKEKLNNLAIVKKLKRIRKNKPVIYCLLLLSFFGITGTMAFLTSNVVFNNIFKTSSYDVKIEENFDNTWGTKEVFVVNSGEANVFIRLNYSEMWIDLNNNIMNNKVDGVSIVDKTWTENWVSDFILGSDGWYYYKKILNKDTSVKVLDRIDLNKTLLEKNDCYNDYLTSNYELNFNVEAIQADSRAIKELWPDSPVVPE